MRLKNAPLSTMKRASSPLIFAVIIAFIAGACIVGVVSLYSSLVQLMVTDAMRGRVMSIFMLAFRGGMPLGNLVAGYVAQRWSISLALAVNAADHNVLYLGVKMMPGISSDFRFFRSHQARDVSDELANRASFGAFAAKLPHDSSGRAGSRKIWVAITCKES